MRKNRNGKNATAHRVNDSVKNNVKETTAVAIAATATTNEQQAEAETTSVVVAATNTAKVGKKDALKSLKAVTSQTRIDRKGANATIRLIAERAASGCKDSINVLCALCDVPAELVFTLDIAKVRAAVNEFYPYYVTAEDGRRVNVKIKSVHYSTAYVVEDVIPCQQDAIYEASKRVIKGYFADEETDYLNILARAARARICGIKQRELDATAVYTDVTCSETAKGVTVEDILEAKKRGIFEATKVNVWKKSERFGYYI